jgi:hypothetical protein
MDNYNENAVPVTGRGVQEDCVTSRFPHYVDNWLADGGDIINFTRRSRFTHRTIPSTHFC